MIKLSAYEIGQLTYAERIAYEEAIRGEKDAAAKACKGSPVAFTNRMLTQLNRLSKKKRGQ